MSGRLETIGVVAQIAFRNLFASRLKTFIVGGIIFFGALIVVVGNSLLDSVDASMSRSVIGSVAGHIQVYNSNSKDPLEVMGSMSMGDPDISQLDDFAKVRDSLLKVPNVKSVVPMGISGALVTSGNTIDLALEKLRGLVKKQLAATNDADRAKAASLVAAEKGHVRQIISLLQGDLKNAHVLLDEKAIDPEDIAAINRASSDAFWAAFDQKPLDALEFLENRIASLAADSDLIFLRYVGTDVQTFEKSFDRMKIIDGQMIPPGKRGFLFSKYVYEDQLKLKSARRLDLIKEGRELRGETIAKDLDLQRMVRENVAQVREVQLQLDAPQTATFRQKLQTFLGATDQDVSVLLAKFFATDDANFAARYDFFYKELAPALELYRVRIGDVLTIKAFTRSGYVQSVNVPVYGTFQFQGLEKSTLAGGLNIMDLVSFRDLYGFLTGERMAEINAMRAASGAKEIPREKAEAELFGTRQTDDTTASGKGGTEKTAPRHITATATPGILPPSNEPGGILAEKLRRDEVRGRVFNPDEVKRGVVLNAAVILKDPKKIPQTIEAIEAQGKADGLPLKAISWQKASGIVGQFIIMARIVLYVAILIIFTIALVIINNALVMATLERVKEIGTLRAIGAQRRFILGMLVIEALVVGLIFGGAGAVVGAGVVKIIGKIGIPATSDIWFFFFSGPRLHPFLGITNIIGAFVIVLLVSAVSSFYPAWLAMRVTPRQAMAEDE
ncbi:MAG TPA: FtsX-like permease family protein [Polyangia bacterium]|jgi:ABC-type lipoprotein release transport system permease subunit|nr:FtsX-like permease family protein [Polyangia bacterium]